MMLIEVDGGSKTLLEFASDRRRGSLHPRRDNKCSVVRGWRVSFGQKKIFGTIETPS